METFTPNTSKPGRKNSPPLQYRNDLLEQAFRSRRDINVTRLCNSLNMSRQTFYAILKGNVRVRREKVELVASALGAEASKIFA